MTKNEWLQELNEIYEDLNEGYTEHEIITHEWSNIGENDPHNVCTHTTTYIDLWNGKYIDVDSYNNILNLHMTAKSRSDAIEKQAKTLNNIIEDCKMTVTMEREYAEDTGYAKNTDVNGYIVMCNGTEICSESHSYN